LVAGVVSSMKCRELGVLRKDEGHATFPPDYGNQRVMMGSWYCKSGRPIRWAYSHLGGHFDEIEQKQVGAIGCVQKKIW
jgi:hypothetical protein